MNDERYLRGFLPKTPEVFSAQIRRPSERWLMSTASLTSEQILGDRLRPCREPHADPNVSVNGGRM